MLNLSLFCLRGYCKYGYKCKNNHKVESKSPLPKEDVVDSNLIKKKQNFLKQYTEKDMMYQNIIIKNKTFGRMLIPAGTNNGTAYNIVSMNMLVNYSGKCYVELHFACNIVTTMAKIHISLQIFKQEKYQALPFPISSGFSFFRESENGESNTFSFSTIDCDLIKNKLYNYSVYVKVIGGVTVGTTVITNSSLVAIMVENK